MSLPKLIWRKTKLLPDENFRHRLGYTTIFSCKQNGQFSVKGPHHSETKKKSQKVLPLAYHASWHTTAFFPGGGAKVKGGGASCGRSIDLEHFARTFLLSPLEYLHSVWSRIGLCLLCRSIHEGRSVRVWNK